MPRPVFKKGNTIARDSNNQTKKRIRKSSLRKTLARLQQMEPRALQNIERSVNEEEVNKEALATSRWLIQQLQAVSRAASQEEAEINGLRWQADALTKEEEEQETVEEEEEAPKPRFSLTVLPSTKDL